MKIVLACIALCLSFAVGCQCTENAVDKNLPIDPVPSEQEIPIEEQKEFENLDEGMPEEMDAPQEEEVPDQAL